MRRVLFAVLALAAASGGCAAGLGGYGGGVHGVVAANQAMIAGLANQAIQPLYGQPYGSYVNVPVCRPQDLPAGMPAVSQPVIVRVDKTKRHQAKDILGGAAVGAGLGYIAYGGSPAAVAGAGAGAGGGLLVSNHEQDLCLLLPVKTP